MTTRRSVASLATTATAALALTSAASAFPDNLRQLFTPYPLGGSPALHASIITTAAEPHFGQPMISVIRTGGGGVVGADYVLKSAADGHVMLFGDPNLNSLRPQVEQLSSSRSPAAGPSWSQGCARSQSPRLALSRAVGTSAESSVPCSRRGCRCDVSTRTSFVSSPAPPACWPRTTPSLRGSSQSMSPSCPPHLSRP